MGASEEEKKSPGLPAWQQNANDQSPPKEPSNPSTRESVIEQARKFLQDDEVRNSTTDKKIAFLESKGLESDEIQELLGVTRNPEASSSPPEPATMSQPNTPSVPSQPPMSQPSHDIPPIITYPEFLTTPVRPAPLITAQRLLTTLYLFGGFSALLYGSNRYLIKPMVESLTTSRHSLAETAQTNLTTLITKLSSIVSDPDVTISKPYNPDVDSDSDSDPAELFHRDIGVQTSLPVTPSLSRPTTPPPTTALESQRDGLTTLSTQIGSLLEDSTSESVSTSEFSTTIAVLREQLDAIISPPSTMLYGGDALSNIAKRKLEEESDQISKLKAMIRSVKGVLLNAKSFPSAPSRYP